MNTTVEHKQSFVVTVDAKVNLTGLPKHAQGPVDLRARTRA